jgi:hypothetical protein
MSNQHSMARQLALLVVLGCAQCATATLLLNETFHTLDNWIEDINGYTGVIQLQPESTAADSSVPHTVYSNITHCPAASDSTTCYRAEVATLQALRPELFPDCTVEYWLGFSSILPVDWYYAENGDSLIYNFQLHGTPMLAIVLCDLTLCAIH